MRLPNANAVEQLPTRAVRGEIDQRDRQYDDDDNKVRYEEVINGIATPVVIH